MPVESLFSAAFHHSPIGQYLLAPTDRLEILAINDALLRAVGRRREDLVGLPLFEAFPQDPNDPDDTGVLALRRSIDDAIAARATRSMPRQRYPVEVHEGERRWFEDRYWSATNTPVYDADGALACISHTTIDITAQVRAEQALKASRQEAIGSAQAAEAARAYLAGVLRAAPIGILVVDAGFKVLQRNPAHVALFGTGLLAEDRSIDTAKWHGWHIGGARADAPFEPHEWPLQRALDGEIVDGCLMKVQTLGGPPASRMLLVSAAPIRNAQDELVGAVAVSMDIEERIRAEDALREADRRKDEFLAMLAHELRNPLAPIGSAASLLVRDGVDPAALRNIGAVLTRQVRHMSGLIEDLLDVARVTRGLITPDKVTLDARHIVAEALEQARPGIEARGHTLQVTLPPAPACVSGDHKRLVQVLTNLLNNAAKFTPEGGAIGVDMVVEAAFVRIAIADTGIGMTEELLGRAFGLFEQGERKLDRSQGGLGIGLALAHSLIKLHGGTVSAASAGLGHGSRFTVCLPRALHGQVAAERMVAPEPDACTGGLNLLVVDDNEDAVMMMDMLLTALGHTVGSTSDSLDALRRADRDPPDVCVLDIGLPDIDGFALARRLRANPRTRGATLIALSGYGQEVDRARAFEAGFDHYFVKPVDIAELSVLLKALAGMRRQEGCQS